MAKNLVVWFSYSGNAKKLAGDIVKATGADEYEIVPENPYNTDYQACVDEARKEVAENARPAVAGADIDVSTYDHVAMVFPNWCSTCPMIVLSFVEKYDFSGKIIDVIVMNGGGGVGNSQKDIAKSASGATVNPAINGNTITEDDIQNLFS